MEASGSETPSAIKKNTPINIDVDSENLKEPVNSVDDQTVEQENKHGGTKRSWVWDHFTMDKESNKAKCPYCKHLLAAGSRKNGTTLKFEKAFIRLQDVDSSYRSYFQGEVDDVESIRMSRKRKKSDRVVGAPNENDFENASITSMSNSVDEKQQKMGLSMKAKFDKYWDNLDNINHLLYVALVLDPRNKLSYLGYCVSLLYGKGSSKIKEIKELVKTTLKNLLEDYKAKIDKMKDPKSTPSSTTSLVDDDASVDLEEGYLKYLEEEGGTEVDNNEVDIYLSDGTEKREEPFDVLGWWKINSIKFPILSQIAKHVLAMPISTVASESAFSTGGRVIDKYRSSLTSKTAEALICAQDWLRSTPSDLQDSAMHGQQLEELIENLEKIEDDLLSGKNTRKDSTVGHNEDWD
ncbi:hypothetical protein QVD17_01432 [Tagetes erecta]|uniref:Uncharacterized protein n=1 Tax=Tagetes erecta TaxID=13708 RepID=A0AAD8LAL0_TARER|nr:hypothetical protein QVD17_01432 [Tagetes erecta]